MWEMVNRYGTNHFHFDNDDLTFNRRLLVELCENIIETGLARRVTWRTTARVNHVDTEVLKIMKKAGCIMLKFGIESGSDRILREIHKSFTVEQASEACRLVRKAGIHVHTYFMAGFPQETPEDLKLTADLMQNIETDTTLLNIFSPMPGTELYDYAIAEGLLSPGEDLSLYPMTSLRNYLAHNIDREDFNRMVYVMEELADKINNRFMTQLRFKWKLHRKSLLRDCFLYSDILRKVVETVFPAGTKLKREQEKSQ